MPVVINPGTAYAEEKLKWEYSDYAIGEDRGQRGPRVYEEFPKMVYKAGRDEKNQIAILEYRIAGNEDEIARLARDGFVDGQAQALERAERDEREMARLAANRAHLELGMSEAAREEAQRYEMETPGHVAEIPEAKKRGRPRKQTDDV
jgi:hypothetical protein